MKTKSFVARWLGLASLGFVLAGSAAYAADAKQLWTAKLSGDAKWHQITGLGTLIVGTDDAITAFDPTSGQQLWTRNEFKKTSPFNAREVPGTPFLMCHTAAGFAGLTKVTFSELDYLTGKTNWQTEEINGQFLGVVPVVEKGLVLCIFNGNGADGKTPGTWIYAYDLAEGKQKWATNFAKIGAIRLHIADNSGKFIPTTDLSGYHDPVIEGDNIYLPYLGCHCLDLNTGTVKWGAEMIKGGNELKKAHAPLRIVGDRIYGSAGGSVYALDKATGAVVWNSERISSYAGLLKARNNALVAQLEIVGDKIFARYGGNFSTGQGVQLREPLGIVVLKAASGEAVYSYDKVKEGLTNLIVLPETNTVMFADAGNLYGLDAAATTPTESFHVPIEFKRKMGGGEVAQLGLGALGGITGIAKAAMAQNKARLDVPVAITRMQGHIVVMGKQHLLGFDPAAKAEKWSLYYAAPSDTFGMAAMFAVTAFAGLAGNAQAAQGGFGSSQYDSGISTIHSSLDRYNKVAGERKSATQGNEAYSYVLTKVGKSKDVGIVGINLTTGETDRELALGSKEPDYMTDEKAGRIFYFKGKDSIVTYQF